jgi:hypothetical protein
MRSIRIFTFAMLQAAMLTGLTSAPVLAQTDTIPENLRARQLPRQHLSGPRFGFTTFTGDVAKLRQAVGKESIMSQFGWQFETQVVSTRSGNQALMEWVALVGGVEQDELNLSLSWLAGYRLPNGLEFGAGPNVSVRKDGWDDPTTSMVIAAGATLPFGELYVPLNLAVALADGGPRITTLLGWIIG